MRNYYGRNIFGVGQDGDVDSSSGEGLLAFEDGNVLFDANSGAGDKGLGNAARFSPRDDNSSILGDESKHRKGYVLTQNVSVENPKEVAAEDSVFVYPSAVDSLSGVAALAEGTTELDKTCEKYALAEEKTVHVAPEELFLVTPDTITFEDAQMRARETVRATCALHGDEYTSSRNREAEDYADRFLGSSTKDKLLIKDPEMTNEGHHSTVPAESQLLISEAVSENPSVTRAVLGVGYAARLSFEDKGCCESLALDSSGSTVDCALTRNAGHIPKRVDSCTLPEKSMDSLTSAIVSVSGQVEDLILSDLNSTECILHKNEVLLSDNDNREKHQSFKCGQELTSSSLRCQGEDVCDHSEENSVSSRSVVTAGYHISGLTRGISGGSLEEDASCFCGEGLSYLQPFTLDGPVDNSSVPLLTTNSERRVTDDTNMASTSCSGIKDSPQQESNQGMVNSRSVPLIVFRRTNPKRAATLKKDQVDAKPVSSQRTGVRKCKKTSDSGTLFPSINTARRKRSCFYRMERKSHWGKTSSLLTFFKENDKPEESNVDFPLIQNKLLRKTRRCKAIGKRQTDLRDRNLDSQCLIENSNNAVPNVIFAAELFISCRHSEGNQEPLIDMPALGVNFLQRDGEHGDKDIESSLTQDISGDNMLGACPGVSSHVASEPLDKTVASRHSLDLESSPASDIYNPVTDIGATHIEAGTSITQDARVKQSEIVPEMISHGMDVKTVNSSEPTMSCEFLSSLDVQLQTGNKKSQKEKTNVKICHTECSLSENTSIQEKLHNSEINNTAAEPLKYVRQRRIGFKGTNLISSISKNKVTSEGSRISFPDESTILGRADPDYSKKSREEELGLHTWTLPEQTIRNIQIEESRALISGKTKLHNLSRNGKTRVCMDKSSLNGLSSGQKMKSCGQKKFNIQNSEKIRNKKKNQKLEASQEACGNMKVFPGLACDLALLENFELRCNGSERKGSTCGLDCQSMPQRQAWVLCDDCHKWRCIPTALADMIDETHCRWTCKDNTDKAFADCSIPQEKTNSEINAELDISDASCDENVPKKNPARPVKTKVADAQPAPWTHIKSNLYLHRSQKSQTIDETMVCHCKPPSDGNFGCGDQCLNRMLNIECEKGTCPCLEFCANQQFQKRKYAKLKLLPCGKKGFGLQLLEDVSIGRFLIEYVGEVLDFATYEARQKYYATRGQKHFYFMTLNGGEVIDACVKGNLGRFINHSCDPNCRTEKWMVNGEVCIGLFAIRDIKKGEEVTFDYNYVRVFGAAAKKCVCGSSVCRGYIGGDPLNTELIVQDDSEDEYLEAVLGNKENKKLLLNLDMALSDTNDTVEKDTEVSMKELLKDHSPNSETEGHQEIKETLCTSKSIDIGVSNLHVEDAIFRPIYEIQSSENCSKRLAKEQTKVMISHPLTDVEQTDISSEASPAATNIKSDSSVKEISTSDVVGEKIIREKLILAKSSRPTHLTKKSKPRVRAVLLQNAKSSQSGSISQFQRVEKELNDLLDDSGGISKRKDTTRGYLKLLFVTAAEGDNVGGASQSIRDLSLILDALLKTKSRTVLMDIINKNGLQMLHNIMKQNRSRFSRIPIIRKLLKVLEFLALKGILTPEHINKGPPCSGMESFTESMLSLTRHNDIQVHQIARSFRDKWIPRMIKQVEPSDREEKQFDSQRFNSSWFHSSSLNRHLGPGVRNSDAIVCVSEPMEQPTSSGSLAKPVEIFAHSSQVVYFSLPLTNDNSIATRTRKRKSRWDQPSDCKAPNHQNLSSSQEQETGSVKTAFSDLQLRTEPKEMKLDIERHVQEKFCSDGVAVMKNLTCQNSEDDIPPGFGSPEDDHHMTSETQVLRGEVVVGYLQDRYHSHLSVSYGIPMSLVQKLGTPGSVTKTDGHQCWTVAPCMPFHPFPPLPPYPRGQPNPSKHTIDPCTSSMVIQTSSKTQSNTLSNLSSCITDRSVPSVSVRRPADNLGTWPRNLQSTERMCWTSSGCERRLFRLDRGNNQKFRRWGYPQPQEGSTCGPRGSLRYRDAGISLRDERQHWPPWSGEDNVFSKGQKDRD